VDIITQNPRTNQFTENARFVAPSKSCVAIQESLARYVISCQRDNVVYWKTKRKIRSDLQYLAISCKTICRILRLFCQILQDCHGHIMQDSRSCQDLWCQSCQDLSLLVLPTLVKVLPKICEPKIIKTKSAYGQHMLCYA